MGFAAIWIYMNHEWLMIMEDIPFGEQTEEFLIEIGFCGVDIFLLLSGMGLTYAIQKNGLLLFYWRRIRRVMIPFALAGGIIGSIDHWGIVTYIKNISGYSFYRENMYTFLWFVPAIMTFYLFFPLYYRFFSQSRNKILFTAAALEIWLVISLSVNGILRGELYGLTNRIPVFLIGILLGWLCQNKKIEISRQAFVFFFITLLLGGGLSYLTNYREFPLLVPTPNCCIPNLLMSVSLVFLLSGAFEALDSVRALKPVSKILIRFLSFFGKISLEFYCMQEWIAGKVEVTRMAELGEKTYNLVLFLIAAAGGYFLYLICRGIMAVLDYLQDRLAALLSASQHKKILQDG